MSTLAATRLPPGPSLPPVAQTLAIVASPAAFLGRARRRHGDLFTVRLLGVPPFVITCDPEVIRQAFTGPPDVLLAGRANAPLGPLVGERSVLLLDGEEHLRERRRLLPPFHGERLRAYERIVERATLREVEGWPLDRAFPLLPAMQEITLEVIMRAVLGVAAGERYEELAARLRRVLDPQGGRVRMVFGLFVEDDALQRRFARRVEAVDELIGAEIRDRRADPRLDRREDVLSMLIRAGLSTRDLRDQVVTLLVAGHETTATALAWTFERVLRHPEVHARLLEGDDAYLDATVKESLRSRPVVPSVGRVLAEPFEAGGYLLPAETRLVPSIVLSHARDEAYPDPEAFRPERFLGDGAPSGYEWLPFGGGVRRCLGASFALFEMRVVLRTILRSARLEADRADPEPTVRSNVTLAPGRGARVIRRAG